MAESAASTQSRTASARSTKRRANTVSTETENKLARAAQSAQRLAQLSATPKDDGTLDLFPDDPTRATLEAMNIDIRQGTLHGFELPDVVLAAVGAGLSADSGVTGSPEARPVRRAPRERSESPVAALPAGFERLEPSTLAGITLGEGTSAASEAAAQVPDRALDAAADHKPKMPQSVTSESPMNPAIAAATVARSMAALRQATEPDAGSTATGKPVGASPQRFAATFAKAATASRDRAAMGAAANAAAANAAVGRDGAAFNRAHQTAAAPSDTEKSDPGAKADELIAEPLQDATRAAPELDRARAKAFADTVDALYGVISDQRRAATDHSRRMKWMLSIVVGALLATVAIGVTQTVLLTRLTRETDAQQRRIEEMMLDQQAAVISLLNTHLPVAGAATATQSATVSAQSAPAPRQTSAGATAALATATKHAAKPHTHPRKPKATALAG